MAPPRKSDFQTEGRTGCIGRSPQTWCTTKSKNRRARKIESQFSILLEIINSTMTVQGKGKETHEHLFRTTACGVARIRAPGDMTRGEMVVVVFDGAERPSCRARQEVNAGEDVDELLSLREVERESGFAFELEVDFSDAFRSKPTLPGAYGGGGEILDDDVGVGEGTTTGGMEVVCVAGRLCKDNTRFCRVGAKLTLAAPEPNSVLTFFIDAFHSWRMSPLTRDSATLFRSD
ncbi:hypothetical protein OF83DRAFT_1089805 [Amylostereum chailletii]|nr:hypothetical protein OF83DRAFT_1089805 [Amylostereum chailletii]